MPRDPSTLLNVKLASAAAAVALFASVAHGQDAPAPVNDVPTNVRNSSDASGIRQQLDGFFTTQVGKLRGEDHAAAASAGRAIAAAAGGDTSPTYRDQYTRAAADALSPLFEAGDTKADLPARLAAAVAMESVARQTSNARLIKPVESIIADEHPAVALWGIRASQPLIATSVRQAMVGREPLVEAIVKSVEQHPTQGYIAHEAYIVLRDVGGGGFVQGNADFVVPSSGRAQVIDATLSLIETRLGAYGPPKDVEVSPLPQTPPVPLAERPATQLLASGAVYPSLDAAQQTRIRVVLRDLAKASGEAAAVAAGATSEAESEDREPLSQARDELRNLLTVTAQATASLAGTSFENKPTVAEEGQRVSELPRSATAETIRERMESFMASLSEAYPDLPAASE